MSRLFIVQKSFECENLDPFGVKLLRIYRRWYDIWLGLIFQVREEWGLIFRSNYRKNVSGLTFFAGLKFNFKRHFDYNNYVARHSRTHTFSTWPHDIDTHHNIMNVKLFTVYLVEFSLQHTTLPRMSRRSRTGKKDLVVRECPNDVPEHVFKEGMSHYTCPVCFGR